MAEWKMVILKGRNVTQAKGAPCRYWSLVEDARLMQASRRGPLAVQTWGPSRADMEICSLNQSAAGAQPWRPAELILPDQLPQSPGGGLCPPYTQNWVVAKEGGRLDQGILGPRWKTQRSCSPGEVLYVS